MNDTFCGVKATVDKYYDQLINHRLCLPDILMQEVSNTRNDLCGKPLCALGVSLIDTNHTTGEEIIKLATQIHGYLMTLQIIKENGAFRWIYDKTQVSEKEVNRISSHLLALLASAKNGTDAERAVAKMNLLPQAEKDLLLQSWNQTAENHSSECCLHQLFEDQVKCDGNATALEYKGDVLSYSRLNT